MGNSTICMSIQVKHTKQPRPKKTKLDGLSWVRSMKSRKEWFCMNKLKICEYANFGCLYVPMHLLGVMWCRSLFLPQIFSTMVSSGYLFVNYFQTWQVKKKSTRNELREKDAKINTPLMTNTLNSCTRGTYESPNSHHLYIELSYDFR